MNRPHAYEGEASHLGETIERPPLPPPDALVWNYHDCLPTDGTWLYVTTQETLDGDRQDGAWVRADLDAHQGAMTLSSATSQPVARAELVVIDQMGLATMVDEGHLVPERYRR